MSHRGAAAIVMLAAGSAYAQSAFEVGVTRFRAGDFAGAIEPLESARAADPRDADTALLLGIAYFRVGRRDAARPLLVQAEADGDPEARASARVFLGLIADDRGEPERAREYYALVARSPTQLGASGRLLLDQTGPERWSVLAIARPGYDSNVALQPATATAGASLGDAELSLIGGVTVRPSTALPLVVDETLLYRAYAHQTDFNMLADAVGATYMLAGDHDRASVAYHFDASTLGAQRYELAHLADASYRHTFGANVGLGARYSFAARDYAPDAYVGYTGLYHVASGEIAWGSPHAPSEGTIGYVFERQGTDDPALASNGHGGSAQLRLRLGDGVDLRASALAIHRWFDGASMGRIDTYVRGDAALYIDAASAFGFVVGGSLARNASNTPDDDYTKWTLFAGVIAAH